MTSLSTVSYYVDKELWSPKHALWKSNLVASPKLPSMGDKFPSIESNISSSATVLSSPPARWVENNINKPLSLKHMVLPHNEQLIESLTLFIQNLKPDEAIVSHFEGKGNTNKQKDSSNTSLPSCQIIHGPKGSGKTVLVEKYVLEISKQLGIMSGVLNKFWFYINILSPAVTMQDLRPLYKHLTQFCEFYKNNNIPVNYRIVVIDNLDNLTPSFQMNIKQFIEQFQDRIKWIFTCTFPLKLIQYIQLKALSLRIYSISEYDCLKIVLNVCQRNRVAYDRQGIQRLFETLCKPIKSTNAAISTINSTTISSNMRANINNNSIAGSSNNSNNSSSDSNLLSYDHPPREYSLTKLIDTIQKIFFHYHFISQENVLRLLSPNSILTVPYIAPFAFYDDGTTSTDILNNAEVKVVTRIRETTKAGIPIPQQQQQQQPKNTATIVKERVPNDADISNTTMTTTTTATTTTNALTADQTVVEVDSQQQVVNPATSVSVLLNDENAKVNGETNSISLLNTTDTLNALITTKTKTTNINSSHNNNATNISTKFKTNEELYRKPVLSYQVIQAKAAIDPNSRCSICTLRPPCKHITEKQLSDLGLAVREKLLALKPSFYRPIGSSSDDANNLFTQINPNILNSITIAAALDSTAVIVSAAETIGTSDNINNFDNVITDNSANTVFDTRLKTSLNSKSFKIQQILYPTNTTTTTNANANNTNNTTTINLSNSTIRNTASADTKQKPSKKLNNNKSEKRSHYLKNTIITTEIKNCSEFLHFGRCSIYNKYQYCPFIHPPNFHKMILYPPKRCPTCTLILPCFHCPYSYLQKDLQELCNLILKKRNMLDNLIDVTRKEIIVLTTVNDDIPFSSPTKPILELQDDNTNSKTNTISNNTIVNKNTKNKNSKSTKDLPEVGKTKRQLAAEAEAKYLKKKQNYLDALELIHTTCILTETNINYLYEAQEWNQSTESYLAQDFSSKIEYLKEVFYSLLKSKLIVESKKIGNAEDINTDSNTSDDKLYEDLYEEKDIGNEGRPGKYSDDEDYAAATYYYNKEDDLMI